MKHRLLVLLSLALILSLLSINVLAAENNFVLPEDYNKKIADEEHPAAEQTIPSVSFENMTLNDVGDRIVYEVEPNDSTDTADYIGSDYTVSAFIAGSDMDCYRFTVSTTSQITVVSSCDTNSLLYWVYDPNLSQFVLGCYYDGYDPDSGNYNDYLTGILTPGTYYLVFVDYNDSYADYLFYFYTQATSHTHRYTSMKTEPTCYSEGYTTYTCSCGFYFDSNYVSALGHDYVHYTTTCYPNERRHSKNCGRCSAPIYEYCYAEDGEDVVDATCTANGSVSFTCDICDRFYYDVIPATGHSCQERILTDATMEAPGLKERTCGNCGDVQRLPFLYRVRGSGRCETAIAAANELKDILGVNRFDTIILASGDNFADALSGSYLAAVKDAPILLYRANSVAMNLRYINNNLAADGTVYILGGTAAVPAYVEETLADYEVIRLSGRTRYDTNLAILEEAGISGEEILVCTGSNFADSLSASATGLPILMVNNSAGVLSDSQIAFLERHNGSHLTIIGGTGAVSAKLKNALSAFGSVDRLSGRTREDTSVLVAETFFDNPEYVILAYSRNFPDGLCGGPLAYALGAPLILTNAGQEAAASAYVAANSIRKGAVLGGTAAVSDETVALILSD